MIELMEEIKEQKIVDTEPVKEPLKDIKNDVNIVLLLIKNQAFKTTTKPYNLKIFGKSMLDWIFNAIEGFPVTKVECDISEDFLPIVKALAKPEFKYTVVLYSDTPLLQKKTFLEILDFIKYKQPSVLKLTRGYVFETEYLFKIDKLYAPQSEYFEEEDFITCYNLKQLEIVGEIFKNRILTYHMKQGVRILDTSSTFVDADVQIGKDVVIYPNNHLIENTVIEDNVVLKQGNVIENSIVFNGTEIQNSVVKNSIIKNDCKVLPYCVITNKSIVEEGSTVNSFCVLNGVKVEKLSNIPTFSLLNK